MFRNVKSVEFNTIDDIVSFVSSGITPTQEQFDELIDGILNPVDDNITKDDSVNIHESVVSDYERPVLLTLLNTVYEDRRQNRLNIACMVLSAFALGSMLTKITIGKTKDPVVNNHFYGKDCDV